MKMAKQLTNEKKQVVIETRYEKKKSFRKITYVFNKSSGTIHKTVEAYDDDESGHDVRGNVKEEQGWPIFSDK